MNFPFLNPPPTPYLENVKIYLHQYTLVTLFCVNVFSFYAYRISLTLYMLWISYASMTSWKYLMYIVIHQACSPASENPGRYTFCLSRTLFKDLNRYLPPSNSETFFISVIHFVQRFFVLSGRRPSHSNGFLSADLYTHGDCRINFPFSFRMKGDNRPVGSYILGIIDEMPLVVNFRFFTSNSLRSL